MTDYTTAALARDLLDALGLLVFFAGVVLGGTLLVRGFLRGAKGPQ